MLLFRVLSKMIKNFLIFIFAAVFYIFWGTSSYAECQDGKEKDCISSSNFEIWVDKFSPWMKTRDWTIEQKANFLLWTIIQKLMIALGSVSIFIMVIWSGYMILAHWQDELLSKWKSIFISWITAMAIALSSYYLIAIIRYIIYS